MGVTQKEMGKKLKYTFISSSSSIVLSHFSCAVMESAGVVGGWAGVLSTSQLHWSIATCRRGLEKHRCNFFSSGLVQVYLSVSLSLSLSILQL